MLNSKKFCCKEVEIISTWGLGPLKRVPWNEETRYMGYKLEYTYLTYCPCCGTYLDEHPEPPKDSPDGWDLCCGTMGYCAFDPYEDDTEIFYQPFTRRYFFSTSKNYRRGDPEYTIYQEWDFQYCIYCGRKLPEPLLDLWLKMVKEKFGVEQLLPLEKMLPLLPEEFQTDLWWKNRGL